MAFLGDAVYELKIRQYICKNGSAPPGVLHKRAVKYVCASFQADVYDKIEPVLTEEEQAVMKRGRNANGASVPKSASPIEYRKATGVEALFGYLHIKGMENRIDELFDFILK